jgi:hypothetical protein
MSSAQGEIMPRKPKKIPKTPRQPEPEPLPEAEIVRPEPISREVIRRRNGSVTVIERFPQPPRRLRGPLRITAIDRGRAILTLSNGTHWQYDPADPTPAIWLAGHLVEMKGQGRTRAIRNRLLDEAITVTTATESP